MELSKQTLDNMESANYFGDGTQEEIDAVRTAWVAAIPENIREAVQCYEPTEIELDTEEWDHICDAALEIASQA
jgi:hypothetical protein